MRSFETSRARSMDDEEEVEGLLGSRKSNGSSFSTHDRASSTKLLVSRLASKKWLIVGVISLTVLIIIGKNSHSSDSLKKDQRPLFTCPKAVEPPENYDASFKEDYDKESHAILEKSKDADEPEFLSILLNHTGFDGWSGKYADVRAKEYEYKKKYFIPYLFDGASIYESASGVGLNLYLVLEVLRDTKPEVGNIQINGNEFVDESARISHVLFDKYTPRNARRGVICTGDSMKLDTYVPEKAFDLVYTGYISTLLNPLNLTFGELDDNRPYYKNLCKADADDWRSQKLNEIAQQRQEEWFARWVEQMTRIAKPGAPVIIEQVAPAFCSIRHDWGGVQREWWAKSIKKYSATWDIDPSSLVIESVLKGGDEESRYNVFMKRNKAGNKK